MYKRSILYLFCFLILISGCKEGMNGVSITKFYPSDEVPQRTNFTITFSTPVVSPDSVNKWYENANIILTPPVKGKYKWISNHEVRFYPEDPLLPSTEYTAEVSPRIIKFKDFYLKGKRKFTFHTPIIRVEDVRIHYLSDEQKPDKIRITLSIKFNYEVDPIKLKKRMKLRIERGAGIKYKFEQTGSSNLIVAVSEPLKLTKKDRGISVFIDKGLRPVGGTLSLKGNYTELIPLPKKRRLVVESAYPEKKGKVTWVTLRFSTPVSIKELKNYLEISPEVECQLERSGSYVSIKGDFKPGKSYDILIRQGLKAMNGTTLERDFPKHLSMGDIEPYFNFVTKGVYLPKKGRLKVGIESVNMRELELSIEKVYVNNIVYFLNTNSMTSNYVNTYQMRFLGKHIETKKFQPGGERNEKVINTIDMSDYISTDRKGIYIAQLWKPEQHWRRSVKWIIITDLGIMAKRTGDELRVYVNSLEDLNPVGDAGVQLISGNNQILLLGKTNSNGIVVFNNYGEAIKGFSPFVIVVRKGDDFSFLEFNTGRLNLGDFDIGGRPPVGKGYEAFLYTDRGVYRPGDTIHIVSTMRDGQQQIPPNFPIKLLILDPRWQEFQSFKGRTGESGADEFCLGIPTYAKTGNYTAKLLIADDKEIGRVTFKVEEFLPARMKVSLDLDREEYPSGKVVKISVKSMMLFGPPASGRKVEVKGWLEPVNFTHKDYKGFKFSDSEKKMGRIDINMGEDKLNSNGEKTFYYHIPKRLNPPSYIRGTIQVTVFETGGRPFTVRKCFNVHPYPFYIGMKREKEGYPNKGEEVRIDFVAITPDGGKIASRVLELYVYKVNWNTVLERDYRGYHHYRSERKLELVKKEIVRYNGDVSSLVFTPTNYGQYLIKLKDPESNVSSTIGFYVSGWGYAPWAMGKPDRMEIKLDKDSYRVGEEVKVQIQAPFPGRLFLSIERDGVFEERIVMMNENTATISLPVNDNYKPNVYIVGTLIRSNKGIEPHAPLRAFGVTPLSVQSEENRLSIQIDSPERIKPNTEIKIKATIKNGTGNTFLTIAAVDEGICQITDFKTPSPFDFFFGKRRLLVETYDIYSFILPELEKTVKKSSPGGGFAEEEAARYLMPVTVRRVKPVVLWSGILRVKKGVASVKFKVPQFQGTLRIMAVAYDRDRFGSTEKKVIISDPIVITPTFPRFLSGRDSFEIPVSVYNGVGKSGKITLKISSEGPVKITSRDKFTANFESEEEKFFSFLCKASNTMGKVHFHLESQGMREKTFSDVDIPLRPASPLIYEIGSGALRPDREEKIKLSDDWVLGTTKFELIVSPFPVVKIGEGIKFLLRYPHGCIEQTTSSVFPLIYFSDIVRHIDPELFKDRSVDYYVSEGIWKLKRMQQRSGGFSYWPGGSTESEWGTIYATHFLVEAKKAGYEVSDYVLERAGKRLRKLLREREERERWKRRWQTERKAYASYVLALMGKPDRSNMNYLKGLDLNKFSDYAQFLVAGAFALSGDIEVAKKLIPIDISPSSSSRETGGNFNSGTKANAIMLEIISEIDPAHPSVPVLAKEIMEKLSANRYYTTQETALGFMALGKALRKIGEPSYKGTVGIGGKIISSFGTKDFYLKREKIDGKEVEIKIEGQGPSYYYWRMGGIKRDENVEEYDNGLIVRREYLNRNGIPVNHSRIKQGDLIVARVTMKALTDNLYNVIITDMLPAGMEIENPRLQSYEALPWIKSKSLNPDYMDIRDDRINIYLNLHKGRKYTFYYLLRAVTKGSFVLPPIKGEAMYDPFKSSVANSGRIKIE